MWLSGPFLLLLAVIITLVGASDGKNYFTNPASNTGINPVWALGDTQVISWKTELGVFNVSIWQQSLVQESAASQGNIYGKKGIYRFRDLDRNN